MAIEPREDSGCEPLRACGVLQRRPCPSRARTRAEQILSLARSVNQHMVHPLAGCRIAREGVNMLWLRALSLSVGLVALLWMILPRAASASPEMTEKARQLVDDFSKRFRPLDVAASRAWWDANLSGK